MTHPKDRKVLKQKAQAQKDLRKRQHKLETVVHKAVPLVDRLTWFQMWWADRTRPVSSDDIQEAVSEYLCRHDAVIPTLAKSNNNNNRAKFLQLQREQEMREGVELPAGLTTREGFRMLMEWRGDYQQAKTIFAKWERHRPSKPPPQ